MVAQVIGRRDLDFLDEGGKPVKGLQLHLIRPVALRERDNGYEGEYMYEKLFVPRNSSLYGVGKGLTVGKDYLFDYEVVGKKAYLNSVQDASKGA